MPRSVASPRKCVASPRGEVNTPLAWRGIRRPTRCEGGQRQRIHGDTAARRNPALPTRRGTVQEISSVPASYFRVSKLLLPRRGHPLVRLHAGPESHRAQSCARVRYPAIRSVTATALLSGGPPKTSIENDIHQLVGPPRHVPARGRYAAPFPARTDGRTPDAAYLAIKASFALEARECSFCASRPSAFQPSPTLAFQMARRRR